ncbi:MAG: DinB family protein [Acidobacteria bacterium]|nr:DinB family protein [Acidobacteriota bacterium]
MNNPMIDRYRRWFSYEKDVHQKALASFESVPMEQRSSAAYQKALDLFGHLASARLMWLYRFGIREKSISQLFPTGLTLEDVTLLLDEMHADWTKYLADLRDDELSRYFEYQSMDAGRFRSSIDDILTQLFGHSWYHRGQIASLVKTIGGTPAITDFVYWSREPISPENE